MSVWHFENYLNLNFDDVTPEMHESLLGKVQNNEPLNPEDIYLMSHYKRIVNGDKTDAFPGRKITALTSEKQNLEKTMQRYGFFPAVFLAVLQSALLPYVMQHYFGTAMGMDACSVQARKTVTGWCNHFLLLLDTMLLPDTGHELYQNALGFTNTAFYALQDMAREPSYRLDAYWRTTRSDLREWCSDILEAEHEYQVAQARINEINMEFRKMGWCEALNVWVPGDCHVWIRRYYAEVHGRDIYKERKQQQK